MKRFVTWREWCASHLSLFFDGAKDCRDNFRPISVLSILSKVCEKHVAASFMDYLVGAGLLYELQLFSRALSLREQPSFFAPGPSGVSRETPLGPGAKKDGCFRRLAGHSTESALISLTDQILFNLYEEKLSGMVFVDFRKAFAASLGSYETSPV